VNVWVDEAGEVTDGLYWMNTQPTPAIRYIYRADPGVVPDVFHRQRFWRCEHHLSAIDNWGDCHPFCEHGCHKSELRWFDNGTCKPPTS